ncbi:MAG: hypothetical protein M3Q44_06345 [bacterium]|nr:hypothetical protein [bacterium]
MKKPGITLVIAGFVILLGIILFNPTYKLIRGNNNQAAVTSGDDLTEQEDSTVYAEEELVSDFPDVPVFPGSIVVKSAEVNSENKYGYFATWKTNTKSVPNVARYYIDEAKKRKWQLTHTPDTTGKTADEYLEALVDNKKITVYIERQSDNDVVEVRVNIPPEGHL